MTLSEVVDYNLAGEGRPQKAYVMNLKKPFALTKTVLLTNEEIRRKIADFEESNGVPQIVGAIDGCLSQ